MKRSLKKNGENQTQNKPKNNDLENVDGVNEQTSFSFGQSAIQRPIGE